LPRKKAADAWLTKAKSEVTLGIHTPESGSITVAAAAELWLERLRVEGKEHGTLVGYRGHLRRSLLPALGNVKVAQLTRAQVEILRDQWLSTGKRATARKLVSCLKGILKHAHGLGHVGQNVAAAIEMPDDSRTEYELKVGRDVPSKEDIRRLFELIETLPTTPARWSPWRWAHPGGAPPNGREYWRAIFTTAVFTGMRVSELLGLPWDNVDLNKRVISVEQRANGWGEIGPPKTKKGHREIPLDDFVVRTLREWRLRCPN
jgi:integrase